MTKRIITVGHSPDPDDAFMFHALAHDKIDTGPFTFRHELQDIETLNRRALRGELDVTAVSIHAYAFLLDKYALLPSGCSMGDRYGPMVVARRPMTVNDLKSARIAVPGTMMTAFCGWSRPGCRCRWVGMWCAAIWARIRSRRSAGFLRRASAMASHTATRR